MDSPEDLIKKDLIISLRSVQTPNNHTNSLADRISRINFQRANLGGFRTITDESLREEILAKKDTSEESTELKSISSEEEDEDEDLDENELIKELSNVRQELLGHIESAHQAAIFALNFVSLSLSKDLPAQAASTVSPELQKLVNLGTLGLDKLSAPKSTEQNYNDNQRIVTGWQAQGLNKAVDSILASATRLEKEIGLETKYWEQILNVSNNGWAICRLPSEQQLQTLGVRIGFSEESQLSQSRCLAALPRNLDGSIYLDQGPLESDPQAIRVRIETNGSETGSTKSPLLIPDSSPIEAFIRQARNTICAQELWQELQREARILYAFGINSSTSTITCVLSPSKSVLIDLVSLSSNDSKSLSTSSSKFDDFLAQFFLISLQLNLRWAHRQVRRQQAQQSPTTSKLFQEPYPLIRPILTRLIHERTVTSLENFILSLTSTLKKASIPASYTSKSTSLPPSTSLTKAEQVLTSLTVHLESIAVIKIFPDTEFTLATRTSMNRDMIPAFKIQANNDNLMNALSSPPTIFYQVSDVQEWILWYTSCVLTSYLLHSLPKLKGLEWSLSIVPNVLKREASDSTKVCRYISVNLSQIERNDIKRKGIRLRVSWEKKNGVIQDNEFLSSPLMKIIGREETQNWNGVEKCDWITWYEHNSNKNTELSDEKNATERSILDVVDPIWNYPVNIAKKSELIVA
ncbi:Mediator of RNA polymerase II transcription subunit 17 [Erysiphe necator]|nr:Mediator of RNA polymerase II transcription subunit 17 [Erysiphe necator]